MFRTVLDKPVLAVTFLIANGVILLVGAWLRRGADAPALAPRSRSMAGPIGA